MNLKKSTGRHRSCGHSGLRYLQAAPCNQSGPTYDGSKTDVVALYENPNEYDTANADGIADVIVKENLDKTVAENVVFSVVFNFRGYDTIDSFVLIAASTGAIAVLRKTKKKEGQLK